MNHQEIELFLDRRHISWEYNVDRCVQHPRKFDGNPILTSEYPWEELYVTMYGNVLPKEDGSGYRMWYASGAKGMTKGKYLCYAESEDGFAWQRIMSDRRPYENCKESNVVAGIEHNLSGPTVLRNCHDDNPEERYLLFYNSYAHTRPQMADWHYNSRACYTMISPDGLTWNPTEGRPAVIGKADASQSVVWDPKRRRYIAYMRGTRPHEEFRPLQGRYGETMRVRYVRAAVSKDFLHWSDPVELLRAGAEDGDPYNHVHQLAVTRRGGQFVGVRFMFRVEALPQIDYEGQGVMVMEEGVCHPHLSVSRDGLSWSKVCDDQVFMPRGEPESWDSRWLVMPGQFLVEDDRMLFYYGASKLRRQDPPTGGVLGIGVASLPRDRFQALRPLLLHQEAVIETKPLYLADGDLYLNADAGHGSIRTELVTFHGLPIEEFTKDDCTPLEVDGLDQKVCWQGGRLSDAIDRQDPFRRAIRIRMYLDQASLYAMYTPKCADPLE